MAGDCAIIKEKRLPKASVGHCFEKGVGTDEKIAPLCFASPVGFLPAACVDSGYRQRNPDAFVHHSDRLLSLFGFIRLSAGNRLILSAVGSCTVCAVAVSLLQYQRMGLSGSLRNSCFFRGGIGQLSQRKEKRTTDLFCQNNG